MIVRPARPCILVTRPEPGATASEKVLRDRGFDVLKRPLTELAAEPVHRAQREAFSNVATIIVTSANALRHAPEGLLQLVRNVPLFAVGEATARVALELGMVNVTNVGGDAENLVAETLPRLKSDSKIGYLCGKLRRDTIETALSDDGFEAVIVETYKTQKVSYITDKIRADLQYSNPDAVSIFSGVSADILGGSLEYSDIAQAFEKKPVFVISDRASNSLKDRWPGPVMIAERMEAGAMHDLIENYFFGFAS